MPEIYVHISLENHILASQQINVKAEKTVYVYLHENMCIKTLY